jgi:spoIIIJ-associated protein
MEQKIAELLVLLGVDAGVRVEPLEAEEKHYLEVHINAPEAGSELIGHHGMRLQALATVITMMLPSMPDRYSVILDVNDYRDQRTKFIEDLTRQTIDQVTETLESVKMQPMNSWERRVVHMTAADRTDVRTVSEGEGEDRRVIIEPVSVV